MTAVAAAADRAAIIAKLKAATAGHGNARVFARKHGIAESYLCDVLKGRRPPGPKISAALGYRLVEAEPAE